MAFTMKPGYREVDSPTTFRKDSPMAQFGMMGGGAGAPAGGAGIPAPQPKPQM